MTEREDVPLISGHPSIDLVNTEGVRRGVPHDLLVTESDLSHWLVSMLLSLVSVDAVTLLASGELLIIRRCANPDCALLFMDSSGRHKWCSMKICGNRAKATHHEEKRAKRV